jgi:hypothetical protein
MHPRHAAALTLAALMLTTPTNSHAQANTFGYSLDIEADDLEDLLVRGIVPCSLFTTTVTGVRVPTPECQPTLRTSGQDTIVVGRRSDFESIDVCIRTPDRCGLVPSGATALAQLEGGKAHVFVDKASPERLHVNFRRFDYQCGGASVQTTPDTFVKPLTDVANWLRLTGRHPVWCDTTVSQLESLQYALELENNERLTFTSSFWYATALTIPLRHWLPYGEGENRVYARATGALNGSVMIGYRRGWTDYKFVRHGERKPETVFHVGVGPFLGLSLLSIDDATTTQDRTEMEPQKGTTVAVSGGIGLLITIRDFAVGVFLGWDHGFSDLADRWDFQHRPWVGVGLSTDQLAKVLGVK